MNSQGFDFICDDDKSCFVYCEGSDACKSSKITCPNNPLMDCQVMCLGSNWPPVCSYLEVIASNLRNLVLYTDSRYGMRSIDLIAKDLGGSVFITAAGEDSFDYGGKSMKKCTLS